MAFFSYCVPVPHGLVRKIEVLTPLNQCFYLARVLYKKTGSAISNLFGSGGPNAIFRFVVSVIVSSLNCHSIRGDAHIGQEVVELLPPITDVNTPATVIDICRDIGVFTSLAHTYPSVVGCRARQAVAMVRLALCSKASTRFCAPSTDVGAINICDVSAVTYEAPDGPSTWTAANSFHGSQPSKSFSSQIEKCHRCNSTMRGSL